VTCFRGKPRPGDESEDNRFQFVRAPNYST
jgi:hypothetical protein